MKKFFFLTIAVFILTSNVYAARPLATTDAGVVNRGVIEFEWGFEYVNATDREINNSLAITTGLLNNLDFAVEIPYQSIDFKDSDNDNGLSDITVSTKLNIIKARELMPDFSAAFSFKDESGDDEKGLGTGRREFGITGILSKKYGQFAYHVNLGCTIKNNFEDTFNYNFAVEYSLNERTNLAAELYGDTVLSGKFHDNATSTQLGMNYSINDAVSWDFGTTIGISKTEPNYKITTGLTFAFGG